MQNWILHRMLIISTEVISQKGEFSWTNWHFHPILLVYFADIRLLICVRFLTSCIVCRIEFCIEWWSFQQESSIKNGDFSWTNWNFDHILLVYLVDIRLRIRVGVLTPSCFGCRIEFCIEWWSFHRSYLSKKWTFPGRTRIWTLFC